MLKLLKYYLIRMLTFLVSKPTLDKCICYHCDPYVCAQLDYPKGCWYRSDDCKTRRMK